MEMAAQSAVRFLRMMGENARAFLFKSADNKRRSASKVGTKRGTCGIRGMRSGTDGGNWAGPLVVTVTLNVAAPLASETLAGTWQTAPRGAPLQFNATVPVKPAPGVS